MLPIEHGRGGARGGGWTRGRGRARHASRLTWPQACASLTVRRLTGDVVALGYPARRFTGAAMRVGKSSRSVADARVLATAHSVANLLHQSPAPMYTLGRLLVLAGDALQSLPPPRHPPGRSPALPRRPSRFRGPFAPDRWYSGVTSCASECAPIRAIGRSPYLRTAVHARPECRPALRDGEPQLPRAADGGFHDPSRIDGALLLWPVHSQHRYKVAL